MLTKTDLSQIKKVVREEVEAEGKNIRDGIESEVRMSRMRLQSDVSDLGDRLKNIEIRVNSLEKGNGEILKHIRKIRKDLDTNINLSDKFIIHLEKRVKIIEGKLDLETPQFIGAQI